ncbi:RNB domain-containing ribonuclease, partial [archaeon]
MRATRPRCRRRCGPPRAAPDTPLPWRAARRCTVRGPRPFTTAAISRVRTRSCQHVSVRAPTTFRVTADESGALVAPTCVEVCESVKLLGAVGLARRRLRLSCGALTVSNVKLKFALDGATGEPTGFMVYPLLDSNGVIEEFMLMANYFVAERLAAVCGPRALLRCHPPIDSTRCGGVSSFLHALGITPDFRSAGCINATM